MRALIAAGAFLALIVIGGFTNDARIIYAHHTGQPIPPDAIAGRSAARLGGQDPLGSPENLCVIGPGGAQLAGGRWAEPGETVNCLSII